MFRSTVSKPIKLGLHIVTFWPGTPFPVIRRFCMMLITVLLLIGQCMYVATHFYTSSMSKLFDCLSLAVAYNLLIIKLGVAWIHSGLLLDMLASMEEDCVKYARVDTKNVIPKAAEISERLTGAIIMFYFVTSCIYGTTALMAPRFNDTKNFVVNVELPFDITESPNYELTIVAQITHLILLGCSYGVFTALLSMMIIHAGCQVDVLCNVITSIASSKDKEQFRFVVMRYQEIILFSEGIEKIFTYIFFAQLISNTAVSCCLGYLVITSLQNRNSLLELVKTIFGYFSIFIEIFTYCFAGEYLNVKSDMILDAAYQISWYNLQPSMSRQVILLLLRSQKGLRLTFGKFSYLSLGTFTWIMKSSASYMSVFLAMS